METKSIQLKTLTASIALILLLEILGFRIGASGATRLLVIGAVRLLDIIFVLALVFLFERNTSCIGLDSSGISRAVMRGLLWSLGFGLLAAVAALFTSLFGIHPLQLIRVQLPSNIFSRMLFLIVGGVVGPVAEEIFFRGLVFRFFRRWGFFFSLCFTTVIFAAMHSMSAGIPIVQLVGGLLFATAFEIEKHLLVPAIIHISGNLAIFSLAIITN